MFRINAVYLVVCFVVSSTALLLQTTSANAEEAPSPRDIATHLRELSDRDAAVRITAAQHLGRLADAAAEAALSRTVRSDPVPQVRGWAARALHEIGTPSALSLVAEIAQSDTDERVRTLAAQMSGSSTSAQGLTSPFAARSVESDEPRAEPAPSQNETAQAPAQPAAGVEARMVVVVSPTSAPAQPTPATQTALVTQPVLSQETLFAARVQLRQERRLRTRGIGFAVSGWTLFGLSYIGSLAAVGETPISALPVIGSLIAGAQVNGTSNDDMTAGLILSSVFQMTGLTLAIIGHVRRQRGRRALAARRVAVVPTGNGLAASF